MQNFFQLLKRERIKKKLFGTRENASNDILNIEMFYNNKRRHGSCEQMSTIEYKNNYYQQLGRSKTTRGDSILDH
ncbi:TPA: IS3 family transposase [Escherichia coli]|nr:IS3 family transposase [Escherichia coli]